MRESLSGAVIRKEHKKYPRHLPRHHNNLSSRKRNLLTHLHQNHAHQKPNVDSSRSCSVIWWTPRNSPASSIPKTIGTWYVPTKKSARKSSNAMKDTSPNYSGMDSW